jgi:hypothetical protein
MKRMLTINISSIEKET